MALQSAAFGVALGESVTRVSKKTGLSRRTLVYKLHDEDFVDAIRYWQDLYTQTLTDFLTSDLRRSIKNTLFKSVSKGEALATHTNRVALTDHSALPEDADDLESLAGQAKIQHKMLK
jgi:hypothetical protein